MKKQRPRILKPILVFTTIGFYQPSPADLKQMSDRTKRSSKNVIKIN